MSSAINTLIVSFIPCVDIVRIVYIRKKGIIMGRLLKTELTRGFLNLRLLFTIILGFGICFYGLTDYFTMNSPNVKNYQNAYQAWFNATGIGARAFFVLLAPLLCTLPYSDSFLSDKNSGFIRSIIHKVSFKKYATSKLIANGIIGGITVSTPLTLLFIFCGFLYPLDLPNTPPNSWGFWPRGMFTDIFITKPILYIFINLVQAFVFGFVFSTFALAISFIVKRKQLVFIVPEILYILLNLIKDFLNLMHFSSVELLFPWLSAQTTFLGVATELIIILVISIIIIIRRGKEEIF